MSHNRNLMGALIAFAGLACSAQAAIIFQTVPEPSYVFNGGVTINSTQWIADYFTVTQSVNLTDIGGEFTNSSNKPIFGAIVSSLPGNNLAWYKANIGTIALAYVDFSIPTAGGGGNVDLPVSITLNAGTYALVFGSGTPASPVLGATGSAILTNCCSGDPGNELVIKGNFPVSVTPDANAYLFVNGTLATATPEPASGLLVGLGLIGAGTLRRHCWGLKDRLAKGG